MTFIQCEYFRGFFWRPPAPLPQRGGVTEANVHKTNDDLTVKTQRSLVTFDLICTISSPSYDKNYCIHSSRQCFYLPSGCLMSAYAFVASNLWPVRGKVNNATPCSPALYQCCHRLHELHPFRLQLKAFCLLFIDVTIFRNMGVRSAAKAPS